MRVLAGGQRGALRGHEAAGAERRDDVAGMQTRQEQAVARARHLAFMAGGAVCLVERFAGAGAFARCRHGSRLCRSADGSSSGQRRCGQQSREQRHARAAVVVLHVPGQKAPTSFSARTAAEAGEPAQTRTNMASSRKSPSPAAQPCQYIADYRRARRPPTESR